MAGLVAQYQQGAFTTPVNGTTSDASVVLSNDNNVRSKHNSHDSDATIHVQSSSLASRPAAGTAQRLWVTTDGFRAYLDTGAAWTELKYLSLAAGGTVAAATTFSAGLTVSSGTTAVQALTATTGTVNGTIRGDRVHAISSVADLSLGGLQLAFANPQGQIWSLGPDNATVGTLAFVVAKRDATSSVTALSFATSGAATFAAGISATTGTFSGNLTFTAATARIIPGVTDFAINNNANTQNNVLITDAGAMTVRAGISATTGTFSGAVAASGNISVATTQKLALNAGATSYLSETASNDVSLVVNSQAVIRANTSAVSIGVNAGRYAIITGDTGAAASLGFYGGAAQIKQAPTGSRGGNAALASLLTALATIGLITDSTSA